ncbi:prepilin-type N-terminal cleavage/methylation domain-containing protein [Gammaproteobacteria bacterium]|nr:prepilin-type N-terminal cleavage/methylation domain-containing protein [Gammaproteobacteria bacterium]
MDFRKLNFSHGFTLLELLVVLILMGIISTVIVTNTSFVDRYQADQVEPYKEFINFLSEESALTKKTLAWFIGEKTQSVHFLIKNEWHSKDFNSLYYPKISSDILFKDARGQILIFPEETEIPFLIFYPSGRSSGGEIQFGGTNQERVITIDIFGKASDSKNTYVSAKGF